MADPIPSPREIAAQPSAFRLNAAACRLARHAYNCGDDPSFHARVDAYARRFGIARESVLRWVDRRMADSGIWFGDPDIVPGGGAR